ncbi:MAG TPA: hypothetical protein VN614_06425 [Rhodanobacter sp.]|jgi:hypothetical protein|nr:hypothetical protein [Rhodanobacter sp.]
MRLPQQRTPAAGAQHQQHHAQKRQADPDGAPRLRRGHAKTQQSQADPNEQCHGASQQKLRQARPWPARHDGWQYYGNPPTSHRPFVDDCHLTNADMRARITGRHP